MHRIFNTAGSFGHSSMAPFTRSLLCIERGCFCSHTSKTANQPGQRLGLGTAHYNLHCCTAAKHPSSAPHSSLHGHSSRRHTWDGRRVRQGGCPRWAWPKTTQNPAWPGGGCLAAWPELAVADIQLMIAMLLGAGCRQEEPRALNWPVVWH